MLNVCISVIKKDHYGQLCYSKIKILFRLIYRVYYCCIFVGPTKTLSISMLYVFFVFFYSYMLCLEERGVTPMAISEKKDLLIITILDLLAHTWSVRGVLGKEVLRDLLGEVSVNAHGTLRHDAVQDGVHGRPISVAVIVHLVRPPQHLGMKTI